MRNDINKEKLGLTVRFSVRLPREQHKWIKDFCEKTTKNSGKYVSMNDYISEALEYFKDNFIEESL